MIEHQFELLATVRADSDKTGALTRIRARANPVTIRGRPVAPRAWASLRVD